MPAGIINVVVTFTSNYEGCHRLFWKRVGGSLNGPVYALPECSGKGNPCSITFYEAVDEVCEPVTYQGYTQACCEDEESTNGRVNWTVEYIPEC